LTGLRDAALICGLAGLFYLYRLCSLVAPPGAALIATAVAGFSMPLLPYLHLFYMESFLFTLICYVWFRLQQPERSGGSELATALLILTIPFVHIRAAAIALTLFGLQLRRLHAGGNTRLAAALIALAAAIGIGFIALNLFIYGGIIGPVMTAHRPPLLAPFSFLAMQLFNVHHGLLAYAPVWLIGFAGLWLGLARGPSLAREAFLLSVIAALTSIGVDAGESWPARYWVQIVPMLAVGFCIWWSVADRLVLRSLAIVLVAFTLLNTILFFASPNDFLENRQSTRTYQTLFDRFGHVDFGLILPVDIDDEPNRNAARNMAILAGLSVAFAAVAAARRRSIYAVVPFLTIAAVIDLARVSIVPPADYHATMAPDRLTVDLDSPADVVYLQLGHYWQEWHGSLFGKQFVLTTTGDGGRFQTTISANQVVGASCTENIRSIALESPNGFEIGSQAAYRLVAYRSNSLLRTHLPFLREHC
jgi:hypothetical protein